MGLLSPWRTSVLWEGVWFCGNVPYYGGIINAMELVQCCGGLSGLWWMFSAVGGHTIITMEVVPYCEGCSQYFGIISAVQYRNHLHTSTKYEERICRLSVIPIKKAKQIARCGHIERQNRCYTT